MERCFNACDMVLAAYRPLCALAPTFKQNTLLEGNYGEDERRIKFKILVGNNDHPYLY